MADTPLSPEDIADRNFVILDTETTGLKKLGRFIPEIVEIAIIDHDGIALLNTRFHPIEPIPYEATHIHGIKDSDCFNAPRWPEVAPKIADIIQGRTVITYNSVYDRFMFHCTDEATGIRWNWKELGSWRCAMLWYSDIWGDWDEYNGNNRWVKLTDAVMQQGLAISDAHSALGDCLMTLSLINKLCK